MSQVQEGHKVGSTQQETHMKAQKKVDLLRAGTGPMNKSQGLTPVKVTIKPTSE